MSPVSLGRCWLWILFLSVFRPINGYGALEEHPLRKRMLISISKIASETHVKPPPAALLEKPNIPTTKALSESQLRSSGVSPNLGNPLPKLPELPKDKKNLPLELPSHDSLPISETFKPKDQQQTKPVANSNLRSKLNHFEKLNRFESSSKQESGEGILSDQKKAEKLASSQTRNQHNPDFRAKFSLFEPTSKQKSVEGILSDQEKLGKLTSSRTRDQQNSDFLTKLKLFEPSSKESDVKGIVTDQKKVEEISSSSHVPQTHDQQLIPDLPKENENLPLELASHDLKKLETLNPKNEKKKRPIDFPVPLEDFQTILNRFEANSKQTVTDQGEVDKLSSSSHVPPHEETHDQQLSKTDPLDFQNVQGASHIQLVKASVASSLQFAIYHVPQLKYARSLLSQFKQTYMRPNNIPFTKDRAVAAPTKADNYSKFQFFPPLQFISQVELNDLFFGAKKKTLTHGYIVVPSQAITKSNDNSYSKDILHAYPGPYGGINSMKSGIPNLVDSFSIPAIKQVFVQKPRTQFAVMWISNAWNVKPIQRVISMADGKPQVHVYLQPELFKKFSAWFHHLAKVQRQQFYGKPTEEFRSFSASLSELPSTKRLTLSENPSDQVSQKLGKDVPAVHTGKFTDMDPDILNPMAGSSVARNLHQNPRPPLSAALFSTIVNKNSVARLSSVTSIPIFIDPEVFAQISTLAKQLRPSETGQKVESVLPNSPTNLNEFSNGPASVGKPHKSIVLKGQRPTTADAQNPGKYSYSLLQMNSIKSLYGTASNLSRASMRVASDVLGKIIRKSVPEALRSKSFYQQKQSAIVTKLKSWAQSARESTKNALSLDRSLVKGVVEVVKTSGGNQRLRATYNRIPSLRKLTGKYWSYEPSGSLVNNVASSETKATNVANPLKPEKNLHHDVNTLEKAGNQPASKPQTQDTHDSDSKLQAIFNQIPSLRTLSGKYWSYETFANGVNGAASTGTKPDTVTIPLKPERTLKLHNEVKPLEKAGNQPMSKPQTQDTRASEPPRNIVNKPEILLKLKQPGGGGGFNILKGPRNNKLNRTSRFIPNWFIQLQQRLRKLLQNSKKWFIDAALKHLQKASRPI